MPTDISLDEAIHTQRAIPPLKTDPVDDGVIEELIEAATRAPNGGNQQPARFIVIRDGRRSALSEIWQLDSKCRTEPLTAPPGRGSGACSSLLGLWLSGCRPPAHGSKHRFFRRCRTTC